MIRPGTKYPAVGGFPRTLSWTILAAGAASVSGTAQAQLTQSVQLTTPLLAPVVPFINTGGHNVAVIERDHPELDPVGLKAGGFTLYPKIELGLGITDNVFQTDVLKRSSPVVIIDPTLRGVSNWSRNYLQVEAGGDLRRFTSHPVRNQNGWHVAGSGRLDLGSLSTLDISGIAARRFETSFSGSSPNTIGSAVPYRVNQVQGGGTTKFGRFELRATANHSTLAFAPISTLSDDRLTQNYRNRQATTGTLRLQYALSFDTALFTQVSYSDTRYSRRFAIGLQDHSSHQWRGLVGVSTDITSLIRASVGVGYSDRKYDLSEYGDVAGLTMEARVEFFPTELTTVTIDARRAIEDAAISGSAGYFNTGVGVRVDHELLRNLLLHADAGYEVDRYRGIDSTAKILSVEGGAQFAMSNALGLGASIGYGQRRNRGVDIGPVFTETTGLVSISYQR